jgi:hypothetical protein
MCSLLAHVDCVGAEKGVYICDFCRLNDLILLYILCLFLIHSVSFFLIKPVIVILHEYTLKLDNVFSDLIPFSNIV